MASAGAPGYVGLPHFTMPPGGVLAYSHGHVAMKPLFEAQQRPSKPMKCPHQSHAGHDQHLATNASPGEPSRSDPLQAASPDHCKILLKNIPHRSGAKDIDIWARRKLGPFEKGLNGVDVPLDDSGAISRGHAVLRLNSLIHADLVIKKLHKATFRGRTITATSLEDEAAYGKGKHKTTSASGHNNGPESISVLEFSTDFSGAPTNARPSRSGPLVVEGSSRKATGNGQ